MMPFADLLARRGPVGVVGLGYVGLPLAVALAGHFSVIGFDLDAGRIAELQKGHDRTGEVPTPALAAADLFLTNRGEDLARALVIIIAVPTPVDEHHFPNLRPVEQASITVGRHMSRGTVVVYESTVYPGVTEEVCVPLLERESGLSLGLDFSVGYSPERINPGDKVHTVERIVKVVAASDAATLNLLSDMYGKVTTAGIHRAPSLKVAEAAKVIENTQRDLNIALMNELALIFDRLGLDTADVLEAAGTKWNFLPFRPGLVGGHCIGVDPYYLTYRSEAAGYHPEVILAGRRINDSMGKFVAEKTVKLLISRGQRVHDARVGVFGLTFKENVPDLRNTRVVDICSELAEYGIAVLIHDPLADPDEARREYGLELTPLSDMRNLDAAILAVSHAQYRMLRPEDLAERLARPETAVVVDVKGLWRREDAEQAGFLYWRL
ncbi:MAG: nucleotide sugar dehydrogenase [Desulfovibrio sp.]|jgi:UDP-N-acetyl-D-galactosamine dehydrogenase|nr:nucleotide sugar dehydrogenase [Desulfovibrio sp.]